MFNLSKALPIFLMPLGVVPYLVDFQVSEGKRGSVMDFLPQAEALRNTERGIKEILGRIISGI